MQSKATTVTQYLAELPAGRRVEVARLRQVILDNLDSDFEEGMQYGMIGYYVPHRVYPAGYHCDPKQPLPFACLASQKNYLSFYFMPAYGDAELGRWFEAEWKKSGKKLDRGKSCFRFKQADDLPLELIGEAIRRITARKYIAKLEAARQSYAAARTGKSAAKKSAPKRPVKKRAPR
jgi:hypothetical protein